jgi:lipopolysaccharide transport system ATP-binding protein
MSNIAIKVENLSKIYRLGEIGTGTISRDMERWFKTRILKQEDPFLKIGETNDRANKGASDIVYSLQDINFEINQGDAVGIIGRNGAGKSTLLKILSRVTTPTTGKINIKGRVASLLEVGTGFHPELTGRENIYLNGAILGMRKREIDRKLDEIINFSGVERYIDTPVKRYSSGMYVRLAFAVSAHLESEILIVDEVLAVGDAEFQKKCLGKMGEVSKGEGRTVLFVSHNMAAIKNLCDKAILFNKGQLTKFGDVTDCISNYFNLQKSNHEIVDIQKQLRSNEDEVIKYKSIKIIQSGIEVNNVHNDMEFEVEISYSIKKRTTGFRLFIYLFDKNEILISQTFFDEENHSGTLMNLGDYVTKFIIPMNLLTEGLHSVKIFSGIHDLRICAPKEGLNLNISVVETGIYRRKHFSDEYRGLVTLPVGILTEKII